MNASALADACLILADGTVFWGRNFGWGGTVFGEICFHTGMTGYQETLTDPSFSGQIITFTFPHIGNTGCNGDDIESDSTGRALRLGAAGLITREYPTTPSNWRSVESFNDWLAARGIAGICGVDTRAITRHIRMKGAQNAAIVRVRSSEFGVQLEEIKEKLAAMPSMAGLELAATVTCEKPYHWTEARWRNAPECRMPIPDPRFHVVAIDYGEKLNILRCLVSHGCKVTVVPAKTPAKEILALKPDGVFLSNGPGDPAATGAYAVPVLQELIASGLPVFGICLGHQLLALALSGKTAKMPQGHRGANHPVQDLATGKVEITSQNHGFAVLAESLPAGVTVSHVSLFDGTVEGLRVEGKPVFSVQYHPESSPGPHDSMYLFERFVDLMKSIRV